MRLKLIVAIVMLGACTPIPAEGVVQVLISDHRDAIGDFSRFLVEIESIELHPASQLPDSGWLELDAQVRQLDLTQLVGNEFRQVLEESLATDRYDALRINLTAVRGTLVTGEDISLDDFSATSRLEFQVTRDEAVILLVDLKIQSQHDHPGGSYVLLLGEARQVFHNSTE